MVKRTKWTLDDGARVEDPDRHLDHFCGEPNCNWGTMAVGVGTPLVAGMPLWYSMAPFPVTTHRVLHLACSLSLALELKPFLTSPRGCSLRRLKGLDQPGMAILPPFRTLSKSPHPSGIDHQKKLQKRGEIKLVTNPVGQDPFGDSPGGWGQPPSGRGKI